MKEKLTKILKKLWDTISYLVFIYLTYRASKLLANMCKTYKYSFSTFCSVCIVTFIVFFMVVLVVTELNLILDRLIKGDEENKEPSYIGIPAGIFVVIMIFIFHDLM